MVKMAACPESPPFSLKHVQLIIVTLPARLLGALNRRGVVRAPLGGFLGGGGGHQLGAA